MEKSKLGISVTLFAALLYFIGAGGGVFVVMIAAGYVLLFEESARLKKTAVKALLVTVSLSITVSFISWSTNIFSNVLSALGNFDTLNSIANSRNWHYNYLYQFLQFIPSGMNILVRILEVFIPFMFGINAYRQKDIKIKLIDNIIDKHFE